LTPTLFAYCTELEPLPDALLESGVAAVTAAETRWARRDIKSTAHCSANILLKKLAADAGAFETIMLENGELTEGSSTTVHVVKDGVDSARRRTAGTFFPAPRAMWSRNSPRAVGAASAALPSPNPRCAAPMKSGWHSRRADCIAGHQLDGAPVGNGVPGRPLFAAHVHLAFADYIRELAGTPAL
jgi:D-alanine transaminase